MKKLYKGCAVFVAAALMLSLFCGCYNMLESAEFRAYQRFADQAANGKVFDKEDVVAKLGTPSYFQDKTEGAAYMDAAVGWWAYEEFDATGYPWRLSITFDCNGQVTSAVFKAGVGG